MKILYAIAAYVVLEVIWLTLMKPFYKTQFAFFINKPLAIQSVTATILVYILLLSSAIVFLHDGPIWKGTLFGLAVYGVYNLTNKVTIPNYPWSMVIVDTLWGAAIFTIVAMILVS